MTPTEHEEAERLARGILAREAYNPHMAKLARAYLDLRKRLTVNTLVELLEGTDETSASYEYLAKQFLDDLNIPLVSGEKDTGHG